jgi:hypothetical protein
LQKEQSYGKRIAVQKPNDESKLVEKVKESKLVRKPSAKTKTGRSIPDTNFQAG